MLDVRLIREQPEAVRRGLATKGGAELIDELLVLDTERRRLVRESEDLKALRNKASEAIGQAKQTWGVLPSFKRRHEWPWFAAALVSPFWL